VTTTLTPTLTPTPTRSGGRSSRFSAGSPRQNSGRDTDPGENPDTVVHPDTGGGPGAGGTGRPDGIDTEALGRELDALRAEVLASLGAPDAAYIRRLIRIQRRLDLAGRAALVVGVFPPAWVAGVGLLAAAKILENMEIGHNVMHGQWDWLRDPEIHSTTWEWDTVCPAPQWRHSHNHLHHQWTNVIGRDRDIGYGVLRMDAHQPWRPWNLAQPAIFATLALLFEYGVGFHDLDSERPHNQPVTFEALRPKLRQTLGKIRRQVLKDYAAFPALSLPFGPGGVIAAATGALAANVIRNVWSFTVIFCGHFPDGVAYLDPAEAEHETRGEWYLRQIRGSANFEGGSLMNIASGNLNHQIEHHLFPDLPSNRYAQIAPRVREICERHGVGYNTGSLARQFRTVVRKVLRLTFP
jgi:fatty acid desaturase